MTRAQRQHLKQIDVEILRAALVLQNLLIDRAALDHVSTLTFIDGLAKTLRQDVTTTPTPERSNSND